MQVQQDAKAHSDTKSQEDNALEKTGLKPIRRALQEDIYRTAFNNDAALKYEYQTDPEVLAAVAALPHAQVLLNTATQVRAQKAQK